MSSVSRSGLLHHLELWVPSLAASSPPWEALLTALGYVEHQRWERGISWRLDPTYIVLEQSPALLPGVVERCRPGLNHLAFHVTSLDLLPALQAAGWVLMFAGEHPWAGGLAHEAAYLEGPDGFEVELVVSP